jgi:glycogen operon protein
MMPFIGAAGYHRLAMAPSSDDERTRGRDGLLRLVRDGFEIRHGHPLPLGATFQRGGINFAVFARHATEVTLVLIPAGEGVPALELPLDPRQNRTGDVWHVLVSGLDVSVGYGFRAAKSPNLEPEIHRFDPRRVLLDPYGRAVGGLEAWGEGADEGPHGRLDRVRSVVVDEDFDWQGDQPLNRPLADSIIYELHVRSFTCHPSSGVAHPGTYRGIVEKVDYLRELGVTAVELMPVTEFEESDHPYVNPRTAERLRNLWGYQPLSFFAPKASYAVGRSPGAAVREFKEMVQALHRAGIEVILDMVFNHTGEADETGPTVSFRGLANTTYYILDPATGKYLNYSGCGNTLNCNHHVVRTLVLDSLRYWVTEMHVDGFRFDLASILGRGQDGTVLSSPPLLESIAADPVLAHSKLIAEAWDAAGLYQVGSFPSWGRWAEWNGKFRDEVRRFVKSDSGMAAFLATRFAGSSDLYRGSGRAPYHSINFVTSHDGFTLQDLVSYNEKHNLENGEGNHDGNPENLSWNCGEEGPSASAEVNALRRRQVRNFAALLLLSEGVPMVLSGDEVGRTQRGSNNAYSQDNEVSWLDWRLRDRNADLFRYFSRLIGFRKAHPALRRETFFEDEREGPPPVVWHGTKRFKPDWTTESRTVALHLVRTKADEDIYLAANAHWEAREFELPLLGPGRRWRLFLDTTREPPDDIAEPGAEPPLQEASTYKLGPRSLIVLVGR